MKIVHFYTYNFILLKFAHIYRTFTQQAPETVQAVGNANTKMYLIIQMIAEGPASAKQFI